MKTVRIVLIAIGLGLAAVLTAGAQTGPVKAHFTDFNPRVSCDEFTQNPQ